MAVPSDTRQTYGAIGIREDLSNIIYNITEQVLQIISVLMMMVQEILMAGLEML